MEGRFSPGAATVLGAGVASHACTACAYQTQAHPCRDNGGGSQCGGVSPNVLPALDLSGECDPRLAHSSQPGYESRICERASGELGIGQTTDGLGEARRSFAPTGGREPQTAPPDARVQPGARTASRDLGTTAAGLVGASHGNGDHWPVRCASLP